MPDLETDYVLALICPNRPLYCVACHNLRESPLVEKWDVDFKVGDKDVLRLLKEDGWRKGDIEPLHGYTGFIADSFPPAVSHKEIITGAARRKLTPEAREELYEKDHAARKKSRIKIDLTLHSPEKFPGGPDYLREFIDENYIPTMTELMPRDYLPDDFETTLSLLNGDDDFILPIIRTLSIVAPIPDVTNSTYLMEIMQHTDAGWEAPHEYPDDVHVLPVHVPNPEYLHLFAFLFAHYASSSKTIRWTILTIPRE